MDVKNLRQMPYKFQSKLELDVLSHLHKKNKSRTIIQSHQADQLA